MLAGLDRASSPRTCRAGALQSPSGAVKNHDRISLQSSFRLPHNWLHVNDIYERLEEQHLLTVNLLRVETYPCNSYSVFSPRAAAD